MTKQVRKQVRRPVAVCNYYRSGRLIRKVVHYEAPTYRSVEKKNPEDVSFGVRIAVASLSVGCCIGYVLKSIGLALA